MKRKVLLIWFIALITLGSGLLNIFSVMSPAIPERLTILRDFFPLKFVPLSRSLTLLTGFALIISSINILKRKKRALYFSALLAFLSVVFHLTKGLDYEEAGLSLCYLLVLALNRRVFSVKSSIPDLRWGVLRFAIALFTTVIYGITGFWLLAQRDFNINFHLKDAISETFLFLTFVGDAGLIPHTRYAEWFLDSLTLIGITGLSYALFALFRPVRYRFSTLPRERDQARQILEQYGRHAIDFFKLWHDKSYFFSDSGRCFLAFRLAAHSAVVLGDPVGPEDEIEETVRRFTALCDENDWAVVFHQTRPDFLPVYEKTGFKKLKLGDDAIVDLNQFTLEGKQGREFRHAVNKLEAAGIYIEQYDPPVPPDVLLRLKAVSDEWLKISGRRERGFTLGAFEINYVRSTPVVAAIDLGGAVLGFVNIIPSYKKGEATIDLIRRRADTPNGLMDYILIKLFLKLKEQGMQTFSLGLAPMAGFHQGEQPSPEERAIHFFFQHMSFLFSFRGLHAYKEKFASWWEPRYIIYRNVLDLPRHALAITKVSEL